MTIQETGTISEDSGALGDRRRWIALVVVCLAMFMNALDGSIVNVALPDIQKQLNDRGQIPVVSPPPAELEAFVTNEMKRWGDIVRASGQAGSL